MSAMGPDEQAIAEGIRLKINADSSGSERSAQSRDHRMGISDIGMCREYARHMVVQTPFDEGTDERDMYTAQLGHAIEQYFTPIISGPVVRRVTASEWGTYDVHETGHLTGMTVEVTLPSGKVLKGHPDTVLPDWNGVFDIKSVDGLNDVERYGASRQQRFQRRLYCAALIQMGVLNGDKPVYCGNIWFDRSGRNAQPHVEVEAFTPAMLTEVDDWLSDVDYAVMNDEAAMRDKPFEWCRKACPFFMSCRGADGVVGDGAFIDDPDLSIDRAASMYLEGSALIKKGKEYQRDAKPVLANQNGFTDHYAVRSTWIDATELPATNRRGYERLSISERKT